MTASKRLGLASLVLAASALTACSSESAPPPTIIETSDASDAGTTDAAIETIDGGCDGAKCVGDPCTKNGECATGACFIGGSRNFCTKQCSGPADCPMPPYANVCNNQGYCRL